MDRAIFLIISIGFHRAMKGMKNDSAFLLLSELG
jgi:hypothetical protein